MWEVEFTDEFGRWWRSLSEDQQGVIDRSVGVLRASGPALGRPRVDTLKGSRHANLKELRVQHLGHPLRVFFAFDPRRAAILLIGGDKTGDERFYDRMIPVADDLYDVYLAELRKEGLV